MRLLLLALFPILAFCQTSGGLVEVPGGITYGPNRLTNPGFETASPLGWTVSGGATRVTDVVYAGTASLRWDLTGTGPYQDIPVTPGNYRLSVRLKRNTTTGTNYGVRFCARIPTTWPWDKNVYTIPYGGVADWTEITISQFFVSYAATMRVNMERPYGGSGEVWIDEFIISKERKDIIPFLKYPNYRGMMWSDYSQVSRWSIDLEPAIGAMEDYRVEYAVTDESTSQVVATGQTASATNITPSIDFSGLGSDRSFRVKWNLVRISDSQVEATYPEYRIVRSASSNRAGFKFSATEDNRVMFNGTPVWVNGVYHTTPSYQPTQAAWDSYLTAHARLWELPANIYLNYILGLMPDSSATALMDLFGTKGQNFLQTGNCFGSYSVDANSAGNGNFYWVNPVNEAAATIRATHANFLGVYLADECQSALAANAQQHSIRNRGLDPDGINFGVLLVNDDSRVLWRDTLDLFSTDPYPLYNAEPVGGYNLSTGMNGVAVNVRDLIGGVLNSRPVIAVIQFFKFTTVGRFPTAAELRKMTYMAIAEGANGVMYWSLGHSTSAGALYNVYTDQGQIKSVTPGNPTVFRSLWHPTCVTSCNVIISGATGDWAALNGNQKFTTSTSTDPVMNLAVDTTGFTGVFDGKVAYYQDDLWNETNLETITVAKGTVTTFTIPNHEMVGTPYVWVHDATGGWAGITPPGGGYYIATVLNENQFTVPVNSSAYTGTFDGAVRVFWNARRRTHFDGLKAIMWETDGIKHALSGVDRNDLLAGNSNSQIRTRVKRADNGDTYLIASNNANSNQNATFTWATNPTVTVYSESRSITPSGAAFTDSFEPFGAHVYQIGTGDPPAPPSTVRRRVMKGGVRLKGNAR